MVTGSEFSGEREGVPLLLLSLVVGLGEALKELDASGVGWGEGVTFTVEVDRGMEVDGTIVAFSRGQEYVSVFKKREKFTGVVLISTVLTNTN